MKVIDEIEVCVDCLLYIANGDFFQGQDNYDKQLIEMEAAEKKLNKENQKVFLNCSEDYSAGFSSMPCGHCSSHLGGDRYKAKLVQL